MIKDFMKSLHRLFGRHSLKLSQNGSKVLDRHSGESRGDGVSEF